MDETVIKATIESAYGPSIVNRELEEIIIKLREMDYSVEASGSSVKLYPTNNRDVTLSSTAIKMLDGVAGLQLIGVSASPRHRIYALYT